MGIWELHVIPEDSNLLEVVNGFQAGMDRMANQRWKTIRVGKGRSGIRKHHGWKGAVEAVRESNLQRFRKRHVLLVIDFDADAGNPQVGFEDNPAGARIRQVDRMLDEMGLAEYRARIHILGVCHQSEDLKKIQWGEDAPEKPANFDSIGKCLAGKCERKDFAIWNDSPVLNGNRDELEAMRRTVCVNLTIPPSMENQIRENG